MLLIISNRNDLATDYLVTKLLETGQEFVRFNTDQYPNEASIEFEFVNGKLEFSLALGERVIRPKDVGSVYFRQPIAPRFHGAYSDLERDFGESELTETMRSLWRAIPDQIWLNHPKYLWIAANKLEQLKMAQSVGLSIPHTIISANHHRILRFFEEQQGRVIAKAVKHGFVRNGDELYLAGTQQINSDFFDHADEYANIPMVFQEQIDVAADVRVVVVGDRVFAASILTTSERVTSDWRLADIMGASLEYSQLNMPEDIVQKCLEIVRRFRLNYSSIDLVCDHSGNYSFLELNPNGQWAWIEQLTGYPIREAIIDNLLQIGKAHGSI